jgi:hypothetical protein
LEITHFAGCDISIDQVGLDLTAGIAEPIGIRMPFRGRPGEQIVLLYAIRLSKSPNLPAALASNPRILSVKFSVKCLISEDLSPNIVLEWKRSLEMLLDKLNESGSEGEVVGQDHSALRGPDYLPYSREPVEISAPSGFSDGVNVTVSGPKEVYAHEAFKWDVLIVNRSEKLQRFAIITIPKRRLSDTYPTARRQNPSTPSNQGKLALPSAVLDDSNVYSLQRGACLGSTDIICLSPDVRVG